MWRRYATAVSIAEIELLKILSRKRLTKYLITQKGYPFNVEEDGVEGTFIDFFWITPYLYAVFLDGEQIHNRPKQAARDELVTKALQRRGLTVERFVYKAPITKKVLQKLASVIEMKLKEIQTENNKIGVLAIYILTVGRLIWLIKRKINPECASCHRLFLPGDIVVSKARGRRKLRCLECAIRIGLVSTNIIT